LTIDVVVDQLMRLEEMKLIKVLSVVVVKKGRGSKVGGGNAHDGCWKFGLVCTFNGDMIREDFHAVTKTYCNWGGAVKRHM